MGTKRDFALVKTGIWFLILGCTLGVSIAAQAANQALGGQSITLVDLERKNQIVNIEFIGWRADIDLRETKMIEKRFSEVLTAGVDQWEQTKPILARKFANQMDVLRHRLRKQRETAGSYFKNTLDQWDEQELAP